ncbi:MAG: hypothetical protein KDB27_04115 [Planctomycetales bacterium]|nr:hypothetical protein [Planctomycetales bacterium]
MPKRICELVFLLFVLAMYPGPESDDDANQRPANKPKACYAESDPICGSYALGHLGFVQHITLEEDSRFHCRFMSCLAEMGAANGMWQRFGNRIQFNVHSSTENRQLRDLRIIAIDGQARLIEPWQMQQIDKIRDKISDEDYRKLTIWFSAARVAD